MKNLNKRRKVSKTNKDHHESKNTHRVRLNDEEAEFIYAVRAGESDINLKQRLKNADNIAMLKKEIKDAHKEILELERIHDVFDSAMKRVPKAPAFLKRERVKYEEYSTKGIPCLFLSDIHHGETVNPDEIGGVNEFNMSISRERIQNVVNRSIKLTKKYFSNPEYSGFVLPLGGDMVSGNIHDELRETNGELILDVVIDLSNILAEQISKIRDEFGRIYVPCVVGNHGRLDKKPRAKGGVKDNFDYMLYKMIELAFKDDRRVTIDVSKSFFKRFDVFSHRFLLCHGDDMKAGNALAGPVMAWKRSELKRKNNYENIRDPFDTMIFGHFHTLTYANGIIANGTTKGMDEWCNKMGFAYERPQQALWIVNTDGTITYKLEVFAD